MRCEELIEDRVDVLYGEADVAARQRVEQHAAECLACREELSGLRRVRRDLGAWKLPATLRPRRPWRATFWNAGWSWAAAAAVLLAAGGTLALAGTEFRYHAGGFSLRLGRGGALEAMQARQQAEIADLREKLRARPASAASTVDQEALLDQVRHMLRDSEERQRSVLQASLSDHSARAEAQRRYDLARISAGLSYLDGKTGQHVARTTELMGYVLEAAQKR